MNKKQKQYPTWDAANGEAVARKANGLGNFRIARHLRRQSGTGEITGEYFTIHKIQKKGEPQQ